MRIHRIAAVEGYGIGPRLVAAGLQALAVCAERDGRFRLDVDVFNGPVELASDRVRLQGFDAIFFGTASGAGSADDAAYKASKAALCQDLDLGVTVRPIRMLRGLISPLRDVTGPELNWLIIGENGVGEPDDSPQRTRVTQVLRHAFQMARQRPRKLLTVVLPPMTPDQGGAIWSESAADVAQGYLDVVWTETPVEVVTVRMTLEPHSLDTIVASSRDADILSCLAAALAGSPGIAASASLNPERATPALFEPLYGSVFGLPDKDTANPVGAFWAGAMMLNHLGEKDAAASLMRAVECAIAGPTLHTPDLGGHCTAEELTLAVCARLRGSDWPAAGSVDGH